MDPASLTGLPLIISTGIGVFFACSAALNKWLESQRNETTQVTILREDRDEWKAKAESFEEKAEEAWDKVNRLIIEQSDMKAQNLVMIEQISQLRRENAELRENLQAFMRSQNARTNS